MKVRKFLLAVIILAVAGFFVYDGFLKNEKTTYTPYAEFSLMVEAGNVSKAKITEDSVLFSLKKDSAVEEEKIFAEAAYTNNTENPESPLLKEFLLKHGVQIEVEKDIGTLLGTVLDIVFYLIFFGIILLVFRKFISPNTFKVVHKTGKTFADVIGMDKLKQDMIQIMDIMKNPGKYEKMGVRMPKGILLEGAPGNGKTLFAKALAGEAKVNFIPAKATDFESMFMAIGPMKVKMLFKKARRKAPCIVFIDEFDGIGTKRNYSGSAIETENTRIVTALLNELDGFEANKGILVLAATNSISALDEALVRPGRFDAKVTVPYPDERSLIKLVELYTSKKACSLDCKEIASRFKGFSCAKVESVLNKAMLLSQQRGASKIEMCDIESAVKEM